MENEVALPINAIDAPLAEITDTRAEIDAQIATAKRYPRNLSKVLNDIETLATLSHEIADDCFYVLRRKGQGGGDTVIEGLSVRMAEIIVSAWGNIRVASRITANDGKTITAQAACHDLETNVAVVIEVKRRITDKQGRTFSEDMQVVTGNAAQAIAFRNAVLKVIPKAITQNVIARVKEVAMGKALDLEQSRQNIMAYFAKLKVTPEQICHYLGIKTIEEIDKEMVYELRATANAIKEGTTTAKESFIDPFEESKKQAEAAKKVTKAEKKALDAIAKAKGAQPNNPTPEAQSAEKTPQETLTGANIAEAVTEQLDLLDETKPE